MLKLLINSNGTFSVTIVEVLIVPILAGSAFFLSSCMDGAIDEAAQIKGFCIDFNWGDGGPNAFAAPGLWADASPQEHVQWYKDMGVNTIQTFIVSCNGYAWYNNDVVPEQPGLKHDFLPEMVRLGHKEGMKVMTQKQLLMYPLRDVIQMLFLFFLHNMI